MSSEIDADGDILSSISAAARVAGMSRASLYKAIDSGRVTRRSDGTFSRQELLDQIASRTDPTKNRGTRPMRLAEEDEAENAGPPVAYDEIRRKLESGEPMDFMEARTANEVLKARMAAVKLDEAVGLLVSKAECKLVRDAENQAIRDRLRSVPMNVAERVLDLVAKGGKAPDVQELILVEIDAALGDAASLEMSVAAQR